MNDSTTISRVNHVVGKEVRNVRKHLDRSGHLPAEQNALPKDVVFDLLSAKRRRDVLEFMAENGPKTTLSDLAEHIAAQENSTEVRLLSSKQRKRVYVALYQSHLPSMDEADVIDFDNSRGTVELGPNADQLYRYLEVTPKSVNRDDTKDEGVISGVLRSKLDELAPTADQDRTS